MSAMPPKAGIELSYDATGTNTMADTVAIDRRTADKPVSRPAPSARQPVVRKGNEVNLPGTLTIYAFSPGNAARRSMVPLIYINLSRRERRTLLRLEHRPQGGTHNASRY